MAEYHFNEGALQVPDAGVVDRSTTALEIEVSGGKRVSIVIARQPRGTLTLDDLVRDSLKLLGVSLRRFKHEAPRKLDLQGVPAVEFDMTWMHETGPMCHRVVIVDLPDVALTLTVAGTQDLRPEIERTYKQMVASLKFRRKK